MEPDHKEAWVPGCVPGDARHIKPMAMVLHVFIYSSTEPASAEPTMYYGCDELQVYRGGENSLIFARRPGFDPWSGFDPFPEGNGYPLQYSCQEIPPTEEPGRL